MEDPRIETTLYLERYKIPHLFEVRTICLPTHSQSVDSLRDAASHLSLHHRVCANTGPDGAIAFP